MKKIAKLIIIKRGLFNSKNEKVLVDRINELTLKINELIDLYERNIEE